MCAKSAHIPPSDQYSAGQVGALRACQGFSQGCSQERGGGGLRASQGLSQGSSQEAGGGGV